MREQNAKILAELEDTTADTERATQSPKPAEPTGQNTAPKPSKPTEQNGRSQKAEKAIDTA